MVALVYALHECSSFTGAVQKPASAACLWRERGSPLWFYCSCKKLTAPMNCLHTSVGQGVPEDLEISLNHRASIMACVRVSVGNIQNVDATSL